MALCAFKRANVLMHQFDVPCQCSVLSKLFTTDVTFKWFQLQMFGVNVFLQTWLKFESRWTMFALKCFAAHLASMVVWSSGVHKPKILGSCPGNFSNFFVNATYFRWWNFASVRRSGDCHSDAGHEVHTSNLWTWRPLTEVTEIRQLVLQLLSDREMMSNDPRSSSCNWVGYKN